MQEQRKRTLLMQLVTELADERGQRPPADDLTTEELWNLFRAFVNTRPPEPARAQFLELQDELLQGLIAEAGVHTSAEATTSALDERLSLWRGDITTLKVDAIVNAANSQMLGCWVPGHYCIDNAIHTYAGVQLRRECYEIMSAQGHEEPTGQAKLTAAWNLPSRHVLHTVGPIASGHPTDLHRDQLASCYRNCLDAAEEAGLHEVAFCCISTGVFGFPAREASEIAVRTVRAWLNDHSSAGMNVIFNVFGEKDERLYRDLLQ